MALAVETIPTYEAQEVISRRTDDILFNVHYLAANVVDKDLELFDPKAEADVLEQNVTDVAEADIHKLGPIVYQHKDQELGQYISLGIGTVDNNIKGCLALDMNDSANHFEFFRRVEEITDEVSILEPHMQEGMRRGGKKVFLSPSPTHHEADPDVVASFNYDDRTMFRIQSLSPDGLTKAMQSFSVFDVPAKAWAAFLSDRYRTTVEPTALGVMQFCNQLHLEYDSADEILETFISGVMDYVGDKDKANLKRQLDAFLHEQAELKKQALFYAKEKLSLEKKLASCLGGYAKPAVIDVIHTVYDQLNYEQKTRLAERFRGTDLYVDDYVAELALSIKTVTVDNRAGLATLNERTVRRMAASVGLPAAIELAQREQFIWQSSLAGVDTDLMVQRSEQQIAKAGVGCGGGCSVSVVDLFSAEASTAREAGLKGTLYESDSLNKNSKCSCSKIKAKIISDGANVICVTCGEFQAKGKRGNLKQAA